MANEAYIDEGTTLNINGEAGADHAWSMEGVTDGNGQVSVRIDLGVAPRPYLYRWRASTQWQASPTQGKTLDFYKSESDGTYEDGDVGTADAALGDVDQRRNCRPFGQIEAEEADTSAMQGGGVVAIYERYVSLIGYNDGGATLNATDSNFKFTLTPIFIDPQA